MSSSSIKSLWNWILFWKESCLSAQQHLFSSNAYNLKAASTASVRCILLPGTCELFLGSQLYFHKKAVTFGITICTCVSYMNGHRQFGIFNPLLTICHALKTGVHGDPSKNWWFFSCSKKSWKYNLQDWSKIYSWYKENVVLVVSVLPLINFCEFREGSCGNSMPSSFWQMMGQKGCCFSSMLCLCFGLSTFSFTQHSHCSFRVILFISFSASQIWNW